MLISVYVREVFTHWTIPDKTSTVTSLESLCPVESVTVSLK